MLYTNENLYTQLFFLTKKAPFLKILPAFMVGILAQYYFAFSLRIIYSSIALFTFFVLVGLFVSYRHTVFIRWLFGITLLLVCTGLGALTAYFNTGNNHDTSFTKLYSGTEKVLVVLQEPLVLKANSYKALATVKAVYSNKNEWKVASGNVLLYFKKDSNYIKQLQYGSTIVIHANLSPITNAGNPGGFNYKAYCAFQDIYFQAFLQNSQFSIVNTFSTNWLQAWLLQTRENVLAIIHEYIPSKNEQSIAEALLIGYRGNLDRDLVQAYSNTGIVHIIAISGLHLGMIYSLLLFVCNFFKQKKWMIVIKPILVLGIIWCFTLLAGAVPSILRSAVMFTCIVIGEVFRKKANIYNMLAASACIILLFQPFSLWDVGFQLSYTAVLGIVLFSKPISHLFLFQNKLLKLFSTLFSVTIAAQIFTLPILFYHFHQLPTLFLFTNILAVPLSTIVLYGLLFLLVFHVVFSKIAFVLGWCIQHIIWAMNDFVVTINELPFSVVGGIQVTIVQVILLFFTICFLAIWIWYKKTKAFLFAITCCTLFTALRCVDFVDKIRQQQFIVYNVPKHTAIDIIDGRSYQFIGDSILLEDGFLRNFHIQPSRVKHRLNKPLNASHFSLENNLLCIGNTTILLLNGKPITMQPLAKKIDVDVIIVTQNPTIYLKEVAAIFNCKQYVFDASNSFRKMSYWQKDAQALNLCSHFVTKDGAFVMNLNERTL